MRDLNALPLPELFAELVPADDVSRLVEACRVEDVGDRGDLTTASVIPDGERGGGRIVAREGGVVAGLIMIARFMPDVMVNLIAQDGDRCVAGDTLAEIEGDYRAILTGERPALNVIGWLSGVASQTRRYVDAAAGTEARICDTRKTTPGLRGFEKYAVRCGGGTLHRAGLWDALLYKDNHLAYLPQDRFAATLADAIQRTRVTHDIRFAEIEVDTLDQFDALLDLPAGTIDIILLDNMTNDQLRHAVAERDTRRPELELEASGGITIETIAGVAATGVERISVGALTHSAIVLDVGLDFDP